MDFSYGPEQAAVAEAASGIFSNMATSERVAAVEAGEPVFDADLWGTLAGANLLGLGVPEELGGSGLGMLEVAALLVEQGRCLAPVPLASHESAALALSALGSEVQRKRWLKGVPTGERILAVALSPAGSPSPVRAERTTQGGWLLSGTFPTVRGATLADSLVVVASDSEGTQQAFFVEVGTPGIGVERVATTDRSEHGRVSFDGVEVPDEQRIAAGSHPDAVSFITAVHTVALCALQLGVCEEAVARMARYVTERHQFGKPLASFQGVALRAADARIDTEAMSVTLWQAAWRLGAGQPADAETAVAKWWAAEAGHRVVHAVQHLHGGLGADVTYPIHRYFLWGKQIELEMGAGAFQLARLGDLMAGDASLVGAR